MYVLLCVSSGTHAMLISLHIATARLVIVRGVSEEAGLPRAVTLASALARRLADAIDHQADVETP